MATNRPTKRNSLIGVGLAAVIMIAGLLVAILIGKIQGPELEDGVQTEAPINRPTPAEGPQPATAAKTIYANSDNLIVSEIMTNLDIPWDITFTPDGVILVNERSGSLTARWPDGRQQRILADFDDLDVRGELGLMGMVTDPNFASNRRLYTCQGDKTQNQIKVVAWEISPDYSQASRTDDPLVGSIPAANIHNGCRLIFGGDGYLWVSTGDAASGDNPQNLDSLGGKILRLNGLTGQAAADNPFTDSEKAKLVYSFGHRNPQGLAWRPQFKQIWVAEHGPDTDDEINLLIKGGNYGWDPVSAASRYYQSVPMTDKSKYPNAIEAKWSSGKPTWAVAGAVFLEGQQWGSKAGWLALATLKNSRLYLLQFDGAGKLGEVLIVPEMDNKYGRLRTPLIGPDNNLYITTSNGGGNDYVLKLSPADN